MNSKSKGENIFNVFNILFMAFLMLITLYPFMYVVFASFSEPSELMAYNGPLLSPLGFSAEAYKAVVKYDVIWSGYGNTLFVVVVGTIISLALTSLGAYALSLKNFMYRKPIMLFIVFTMFFSGGLIPSYFTMKNLGLYNSLWVLILPCSISTYNMIIMRSAIYAIPESLQEAANIDGASHFTILTKIVLPLCGPTLAVLALYYSVAYWNSWFNASIYIQDRDKFPLQLVLREIIMGNESSSIQSTIDMGEQQSISATIKYATIIVSTLPILIVYPYLQKYFVKGTMIGAVKE